MDKHKCDGILRTVLGLRLNILIMTSALCVILFSCVSAAGWNKKIRDESRMNAPDGIPVDKNHLVFIDKEYAPSGDVFYVTTWAARESGSGGVNVPLDAIEYGLLNFAGLEKRYKYFNRISRATQKGLSQRGFANTSCIYNGKPKRITFVHHKKERHIIIWFSDLPGLPKEVFAIDISKIAANP